MRSFLRLLPAVLLALPTAARANDAFFATETINVTEQAAAPASDPSDPAWKAAPESRVRVTPQHTVRFNDKLANASLDTSQPFELVVKALAGNGQLGLFVSWPDATQDRLSPDDTVSFGDAVAMQLPTRFGAGERLPHVAMGDEASPVHLLMQRAVVGGAQSSRFVAAGFGSLTRIGAAQPSSSMRYDVGAKRWNAVFLRPLVEEGHSIDAALVPVAFAVWDGAGRQRGGAKSLSPWKFLRRASLVVDPKYVDALSWGFGTTADVAKGKALVSGICIACHRFADKRFAPEGLAPGLDTIGAIAAPSYLRDSIMDPSLVVVMHPNPNRHYNKGAPADPNGAFPNNPAFEWSTLDPAGKKLSKMPPFAAFPPDDIAAMVAYLRTLDGSRSTP